MKKLVFDVGVTGLQPPENRKWAALSPRRAAGQFSV